MQSNFYLYEKLKDYSDHVRIVFLGKTGNGKSLTCNNLIGVNNFFKTSTSANSITQLCQAASFQTASNKVLIVDTPGLNDTERKENDLFNELKNVMEFSYPGPHCFVITLACNKRFIEEDQDCIKKIEKFFGLDALEYDGISLNDYIRTSKIDSINKLIAKCNHNYLGVSNRWNSDDCKMVAFRHQLMQLVNKIIASNTGVEFYTTGRFKTSQKHYELEQKKIKDQRKENEILADRARELENRANILVHQINNVSSNDDDDNCTIL